MSEVKKFLVRAKDGEHSAESEQAIVKLLESGHCFAGSFVFNFESNEWSVVADLPFIKPHFEQKPQSLPTEKKVVYFMSHDQQMCGPFSLREILEKEKAGELAGHHWVYVDGDKEWRQISSVKILREALPVLPTDTPAPPPVAVFQVASAPAPLKEEELVPEVASGEIHTNAQGALAPHVEVEDSSILLAVDSGIEEEEPTMAFSVLGLSAQPSPPPEMRKPPMPAPPPAKPAMPIPPVTQASSASQEGSDDFDGLTAEIPSDPIWLVKQANSELVSGPFKFLDVAKFLAEGKVSKNDKISKVGSKSFVRIAQQYEFNVKYSVETVVEGGIEKQKIFIRRRHPRLPYLAPIQITHKGAPIAGTCINISAGGILMEVAKAEFNLGDVVELKILPAIIKQPISCSSLVIGKIPKIPPGYALKFQDLKPGDKEAIEFFIQESMKREQSKT